MRGGEGGLAGERESIGGNCRHRFVLKVSKYIRMEKEKGNEEDEEEEKEN